MEKNKLKQTYQYKIEESILNDGRQEVKLPKEIEYLFLKFFIVNTPCETISRKSISLKEYGWKDKFNSSNGLQHKLLSTIDFDSNRYVFTDKDDLSDKFNENQLLDNMLEDIVVERCVIGKTQGTNKLLKLLRHIRNCLAHGKYIVVENSINQNVMIMQDDNTHNVTARIVIKVDTLIGLIKTIDRNNIIGWEELLQDL